MPCLSHGHRAQAPDFPLVSEDRDRHDEILRYLLPLLDAIVRPPLLEVRLSRQIVPIRRHQLSHSVLRLHHRECGKRLYCSLTIATVSLAHAKLLVTSLQRRVNQTRRGSRVTNIGHLPGVRT